MSKNLVLLNNFNVTNYDEDDPETIIHVRLLV